MIDRCLLFISGCRISVGSFPDQPCGVNAPCTGSIPSVQISRITLMDKINNTKEHQRNPATVSFAQELTFTWKKEHELVKCQWTLLESASLSWRKNNFCLWNVYLKPKRKKQAQKCFWCRAMQFFVSLFSFFFYFCPFVYKIIKKILKGKQLNKIVIYSAYIYIKAFLLGRKVSWSGTLTSWPHFYFSPPPIPTHPKTRTQINRYTMIHYSAILPLCYLQWMDKYSYRHRLKHFNMEVQVKGKVHIFCPPPKKKSVWNAVRKKKKKKSQTSRWSNSRVIELGSQPNVAYNKKRKELPLHAARQALRRNSALISGTGPKANSALSYLYNAYFIFPAGVPAHHPSWM